MQPRTPYQSRKKKPKRRSHGIRLCQGNARHEWRQTPRFRKVCRTIADKPQNEITAIKLGRTLSSLLNCGRHRERPDIRGFGRSGETELFDVAICHPLSQARIRDASENPLNLSMAAWTAKVSRLQAAGTEFNLPRGIVFTSVLDALNKKKFSSSSNTDASVYKVKYIYIYIYA